MQSLLESLGGLGLFLFGMAVMTSGLKKLAGERLHHWLGRATRTPASGAATGAAVTALVQSSSATTVAAVGFVGAGLMTFTQSLGILFGANIGTTITGWAVALLGFKLKLGTAALPLLFVSALLYLVKSRPRLRGSGKALAGFALIFLGIGLLQDGLAGARDVIDLSRFNADSLGGRVVLVFVGIALTLVTQSSSATVAAALTALNTGVLDLPQAAAAIIGADVGTTATAALATIGGNTASRRTGFAHVLYNVLTGMGAFFLLPLYLFGWNHFAPAAVGDSPEVVAVSFHTVFNVLGVIAILPFTARFARLIERLVPQREASLTEALDPRLLGDPVAAADTLEITIRKLAATSLRACASQVSEGLIAGPEETLEDVLLAVPRARKFAVQTGDVTEEHHMDTSRLFAALHFLDHTERFTERALDRERRDGLLARKDLRSTAEDPVRLLATLADDLEGGRPVDPKALKDQATELEEDKSRIRAELIAVAARGDLGADELDAVLDATRWLRRLTYHAARLAHYAAEMHALRGR